MNILLHRNSTIPSFWRFQIIGWLIYAAFDYYESIEYYFLRYPDINAKLGWFLFVLTGFSITIIFRYIYKATKIQNLSIFYKLVILVLCSIIGSASWIIIRNGIDFGILSENKDLDLHSLFFGFGNFNHAMLRIGYFTARLFGWSVLYFGIKSWYSLIEEKIRSEKMLVQVKNAQLQMLRYQINPHFLFNSLNSIKALTYENPEHAGIMITEFSEFLRATLNYNDRVFVPAEEEIEIIGKYLSIEKIRFEDRLDYNISYDEDILDKELLCFITQPLVENSIKHGLINNMAGMKLNISFKIVKEDIVVEITNNGVLNNNGNSNGKGIKNVIERLENAYSNRYKLSIGEENNIVKVSLLMPKRQ